jgi:ElaB/YqjD/DUF883 family membrane-anchored ribosome-binding protein
MTTTATTTRKERNGTRALTTDARIAVLRGDIERLQKNMKSLAADAGDAANSGVHDAIRATEDAAQQVLEDAEEWANENMDSVRERIRDEPLKYCLISFGVGAILGALFLRR